MSEVDLAYSFDRSGVFYPAVMNYWVLYHGFVELLSRHMVGLVEGLHLRGGLTTETLAAWAGDGPDGQALLHRLADPARRTVTEVAFPLVMRATDGPTFSPPDPEDLARELFNESNYLTPSLDRAAGVLLITAWEASKQYADHGPLWEVLLHCRNAAAHGGRFQFRSDQPRFPAEWGSIAITKALEGERLFRLGNGVGLLWPADPVLLLLAIEKAHPGLHPDLSDFDSADGGIESSHSVASGPIV
jgi:hypothetical protein